MIGMTIKKKATVAAALVLLATVTSAPLAAAQSITTEVTVSGTPTTTVISPSPTGRGYCEFFVDHWDCDSTRPEATAVAATTASASSSAATIEPSPVGQSCTLHGDHYHCDGPSTATAVAAAAEASPTGRGSCTFHGDHWDCDGDSADSHAGHDHSGHSHAGHSHGPDAVYGCGLAPLEDYNLPLHIGTIFILLASSAFGSYFPILVHSKNGERKWTDEVFFVCRHFGTGVLISTAFVHLLSHAMLYWSNECVGELKYEATGPAIAMAAVWLVFLVDFFLLRALRKRSGAGSVCSHDGEQQLASAHTVEKRESHSSLDHSASEESTYGGLTYAQAKVAEWDVIAIELGIIFHSILIGITLGVATGAGFVALLIAITFHQLFEGLALGSRLSLLTWKGAWYKVIMATAFVLTTPLGVAIGVGVRSKFNGNGAGTLIVLGTFHALSAGILLYTALVELLSGDFIHSKQMQNSSLGRCIAAVAALTIGIMAMSVLALWA
ncbi:Zinc/iron permease [Kalmanozyma brasiliensis GHG001]|uniref:Fe2+/Zn2+ regulated transporter n=1 Tax=Kalmanozyma brasiliensis (strain GHG001) TaxID=1365824 RepID=V5ER02_KALBG|nr:Zinc/iron permease [Kalmanozyma brasiliensis GHG001]EST05378.1 Zinc/iron permease [Kalmanozyma brasiliensis GHG001]